MNKKIILVITLITLFLLIFIPLMIYLIVPVSDYLISQHESASMVKKCYKSKATFTMGEPGFNDPDECYANMFNLLLPYLLVHKVELKDKTPVEFILVDSKRSLYNVPTFATDKTDALISYGVGRTCLFEDNYKRKFKKPAYAYDCGNETNICEAAKFEKECVGTGKNAVKYNSAKDFIHPEDSTLKIHEYSDKIKAIGLDGKDVLLKMNIVGAEDKVIDGILQESDHIPVILMYIHIKSPKMMVKKFKTLSKLNEKYVLVARTVVPVKKVVVQIEPPIFSNKYVTGQFSRNISLTYINKNLIKSSYIPLNQVDTIDSYAIDRKQHKQKKKEDMQKMNIKWVVVVGEPLRKMFGIRYE